MSNKTILHVGLVSLGCSKNLVDTQVMCGVLLTEGVELAPSPDEADVVLINTCAFIQAARDEADAEIRRAIGLKRDGKIGAVVVAGCLPQRYGAGLAETYPEVDAWLGVDRLEEIADIVKRVGRQGLARKRALVAVDAPATCGVRGLGRVLAAGVTRAKVLGSVGFEEGHRKTGESPRKTGKTFRAGRRKGKAVGSGWRAAVAGGVLRKAMPGAASSCGRGEVYQNSARKKRTK